MVLQMLEQVEDNMQKQVAIKLWPVQCRMARAALNLSIQELAERAGVSANTISRLENEDVDVSEEAVDRLLAVFRDLELIGENGGGLGVRLSKPSIHMLRKPSWHPFYERFAFIVGHRGRKVNVLLPVTVFLDGTILDDVDRHRGNRTPEEFKESFDKNRDLILQACEKAIVAGKVQHDGRLYLHHEDFPPSVV